MAVLEHVGLPAHLPAHLTAHLPAHLPARVVSPCNVTSPCLHSSDAEQNFAIEIEMRNPTLLFSLKILGIVCTELLNCDCFGIWGFCTCWASLEAHQFWNLTSATFRLWHA